MAGEPLFVDIVGRAKRLKAQAEAYRAGLPKEPAAVAAALKGFDAFGLKIGELSDLDMKGHVTPRRSAGRSTTSSASCAASARTCPRN